LALAKEAVRRAQESVSHSQTASDAEIAQAKSEARQSHTQAALLQLRLKESNGLCKHAELAQVECERVLREMGEELDEWGKELEECCSEMAKELEDWRCQLRDLGQGACLLRSIVTSMLPAYAYGIIAIHPSHSCLFLCVCVFSCSRLR